MKFDVIDSPAAKAIVGAVGYALTLLETELAPHTTPWIIVGVVLGVASSLGIYLQPNAKPEPVTVAPVTPATP